MTRAPSALLALGLTLALAGGAAPAGATVIVRVLAPETVAVGDPFVVELRADLSDAVLGWGLDLALGPLEMAAASVLGPVWLPLGTADGDELGGFAFPAGVVGPDVLLASLRLSAPVAGTSLLLPSVTPGDLTEGFALDPSGFDPDVSFVGASVEALPGPSPPLAALSAAAALGWALRGRR